MASDSKRQGGNLFIVDNSDSDRKVLRQEERRGAA